jgi:hypothetical protein
MQQSVRVAVSDERLIVWDRDTTQTQTLSRSKTMRIVSNANTEVARDRTLLVEPA